MPAFRCRASSIAWISFAFACGDDEAPLGASTTMASNPPGPERPSGWSDATHGNEAAPSYATLFDGDRVQRIDIRMEPELFASMQSDLGSLLAERPMRPTDPFCTEAASAVPCTVAELAGGGAGTCRSFGAAWLCLPDGAVGGFGAPAAAEAPDGGPPGAPPPAAGPGPGMPPNFGGAPNLISRDPMYVPVDVEHGGNVWTRVGMRYKGNSSLAASSGAGKLPFRLNFDHYEVEHPEVDDQRFYGFQEMTFSSNWSDNSQLREAFANEVFRDRGVPAARSAFYRVFVDVGTGPEYWGLYTMVEDPSDALLEAQLGSNDGNLYKPEGPGADWTAFDTQGFVKKNNQEVADWSDVESAITALHAPIASPEVWRTNLEARLDVDGFLTWLAVNTVIVNWDAYGALAHNYYLYADPARGGQIRWIPWDHNLSMSQGGLFGAPTTATPEVEIFHGDVGNEWPLISRLLADPAYAARYRELLLGALDGLFTPEAGTARLRQLHALIEPYVTGVDGERESHRTIASPEAFATSIDGPQGLAAHLSNRRERVLSVLSAP